MQVDADILFVPRGSSFESWLFWKTQVSQPHSGSDEAGTPDLFFDADTFATNFSQPFDARTAPLRPIAQEQRCAPASHQANMGGISLRSGCHCNPGVREVVLGLSTEEMAAAFKNKDRSRDEEFLHVIDGKTTGAARVSLGLVSTFADVFRFREFARSFRDVPTGAVPSAPAR